MSQQDTAPAKAKFHLSCGKAVAKVPEPGCRILPLPTPTRQSLRLLDRNQPVVRQESLLIKAKY